MGTIFVLSGKWVANIYKNILAMQNIFVYLHIES